MYYAFGIENGLKGGSISKLNGKTYILLQFIKVKLLQFAKAKLMFLFIKTWYK